MSHKIELPRYVVRGERVFDDVALVAEEISKKKPLIVADKTTYEIAGKIVQKKIEGDSALIESATFNEAENVEELIREKGYDLAVGVGGGSVLDVTKAAAFNTSIPFFSIPTAISNDGIASAGASLFSEGRRKSIQLKVPLAIFADLEIIKGAPRRLFSAGCGDAISKFTSVKDWKLASEERGEYYGGYAAELARLAAEMVIKNAEEMAKSIETGVHILFEVMVSSGVAMSMANSSRPASGAEHNFSHALDMIAPEPALHGEQVGIGTIMMSHLHGEDYKIIKNTLKRVGAPTTAEELGIDEEYIIKALVMANSIRKRYTILRGGLSEKEARALAEETEVI